MLNRKNGRTNTTQMRSMSCRSSTSHRQNFAFAKSLFMALVKVIEDSKRNAREGAERFARKSKASSRRRAKPPPPRPSGVDVAYVRLPPHHPAILTDA